MLSELVSMIEYLKAKEAKILIDIEKCRDEMHILALNDVDQQKFLEKQRQIENLRQNIRVERHTVAKKMHLELGYLIDQI
jgi:hypothetical protein